MEQLSDDTSVPRNVRRGARESLEKNLLNKEKDLDVRIAGAQNQLQDLYEDPNIPMHARTLILNVLAQLETLLSNVV